MLIPKGSIADESQEKLVVVGHRKKEVARSFAYKMETD